MVRVRSDSIASPMVDSRGTAVCIEVIRWMTGSSRSKVRSTERGRIPTGRYDPRVHDPRAIRLLCLDVDGVLTDGGILIDDRGHETKRFHVHDGAGLRLWRALGLEVAVITGRRGMALRHRLEELGIRIVVGGAADKLQVFRQVSESLGAGPAACAMIGDDLPDLPVLRACGYPVAVPDAVAEVKAVARYVTSRPGGGGAVRETIEHLLRAMGRWQEALDRFAG